jgi:hypothetical protein
MIIKLLRFMGKVKLENIHPFSHADCRVGWIKIHGISRRLMSNLPGWHYFGKAGMSPGGDGCPWLSLWRGFHQNPLRSVWVELRMM